MAELNKFQRIAADNYACGDHSYITDSRESADVGDTLFGFVISELADSEGCEDIEDAIRRIEMAISDLESVLHALRDAS